MVDIPVPPPPVLAPQGADLIVEPAALTAAQAAHAVELTLFGSDGELDPSTGVELINLTDTDGPQTSSVTVGEGLTILAEGGLAAGVWQLSVALPDGASSIAYLPVIDPSLPSDAPVTGDDLTTGDDPSRR